MKSMTCKQLGGACDQAFEAESFEEMAKLSKQHAMEMFQQGDQAHLDAMKAMQQLMTSSEAMQEWMAKKRAQFDTLPDN